MAKSPYDAALQHLWLVVCDSINCLSAQLSDGESGRTLGQQSCCVLDVDRWKGRRLIPGIYTPTQVSHKQQVQWVPVGRSTYTDDLKDCTRYSLRGTLLSGAILGRPMKQRRQQLRAIPLQLLE